MINHSHGTTKPEEETHAHDATKHVWACQKAPWQQHGGGGSLAPPVRYFIKCTCGGTHRLQSFVPSAYGWYVIVRVTVGPLLPTFVVATNVVPRVNA